MNTLQNRANAVFAFSVSALFCLLGAIAVSSLIMPGSPTANVSLANIKVLTGRYDKNWNDYGTRDNEFASAQLEINADLSSLFNWNTKQLFVYAVATYETPTSPKNEIFLWDAIIKNPKQAVFKNKKVNNKYTLIDANKKWRGIEANVSLHWNVVPYVGFMTYGRSASSQKYAFPLPSGIQK